MSEHKNIIETLETTFRSMRALVLSKAGNIDSEDKADGTPQTHIDIEAEQIIRSALTTAHPELIHFGEESGYSDDLPEFCCLIDALDGTKSYIKNEPAFTGMAVLIENNTAVASVIYNYTTDEMFVAYRGAAAFKNGVKLDITNTPLPDVAFCRERMVDGVNKLLISKNSTVVCEPGPSGAGYGFSLVADGLLAARFNFPHFPGEGHIHDYAPGILLVEEAGGVVIDVDESQQISIHSKSFIACHPKLAPTVIELIAQIKQIELSSVSSR